MAPVQVIPVLIQTHGYTEAVLRAVQRRRVEVDDVADAVAVRRERQPGRGAHADRSVPDAG
ncbi:Scr1 family TA system antitoxin-like transcriptional regulator [Streptomyces sp. IBSNAI002]|uniref:Scr1 family TA system antitoxin-like transcriptional regulator n=1 Tax=Streptomyces sp. IBSNAI002 TaxID=3457500 RepID=UPI003FCEFBF3